MYGHGHATWRYVKATAEKGEAWRRPVKDAQGMGASGTELKSCGNAQQI